MVKVIPIDDLNKFFQKQRSAEEKWAASHEFNPDDLKTGWWVAESEGLLILGEASEGTLPPERWNEYDEGELAYERAGLADARRRGYVFGRWYSHVVPEGELGSWHLSQLIPIPEECFRRFVADLDGMQAIFERYAEGGDHAS